MKSQARRLARLESKAAPWREPVLFVRNVLVSPSGRREHWTPPPASDPPPAP